MYEVYDIEIGGEIQGTFATIAAALDFAAAIDEAGGRSWVLDVVATGDNIYSIGTYPGQAVRIA